MTALATRTGLACEGGCGTVLTGGADTFGEPGRSFCYLCWNNEMNRTSPTAITADKRYEFLKKLMEKLEDKSEMIESEIEDLEDERDALETRISAIENELNGHGKCKEEEPKPK